ncbi:MAG: conserved membrane protein of unknown function [Promethearchaeota archaeon]|nr:MAG: conserved membrane protein of unknown function [Candidatus Lokiarchaeota archaeon]
MSQSYSISIRDLLSESLLRDVVLFITILIATLTQGWDNISLFLFPLCSFGFLLFFRIIHINKHKTTFEGNLVIYNPLGSERIIGNRFQFSSLILMIYLFWFGAESLYHPQLIDNYLFFFLIIYLFFYTFTFFWIFKDLWKYSGIKIHPREETTQKKEVPKEQIVSGKDEEKIISFLKPKLYRNLFLLNFAVFLILNILNILLTLITSSNSFLGFSVRLPGSGINNLGNIYLSPFLYVILILPPFITILSMKFIYTHINKLHKDNFKNDAFYELISSLPKNKQVQIIENLKALNRKFKDL